MMEKSAPEPAEDSAMCASLIEVRRNEDGSLDEVCADAAGVHLEQMDNCGWFLSVYAEGRRVNVWLRSTRKIATYVEVDGSEATVVR